MDLTALLLFTCKCLYGMVPTLWQISLVSSQTGTLSRDMKFGGEQLSLDLHCRPRIRGINNNLWYHKGFSRDLLRISNAGSHWLQWTPAKVYLSQEGLLLLLTMDIWRQAGLSSMETHETPGFLVTCRTGASAGVYRLDLDGKQETPVWWKHSHCRRWIPMFKGLQKNTNFLLQF